MRAADVITLDWESHPIEARPNFPPRPIGLAVKDGYNASRYLAFGHPSGNNATYQDALSVLRWAWDSGRPILCHNIKFDLQMATEGAGLPLIPWRRQHDTMLLMFLDDPNRQALDLKRAAEAILGLPPEERDAVSDWVWEHRKALREAYPGEDISRTKGKVNKVWRWFSKVPAAVLAPYAIGDVERTFRLFEHLHPKVLAAGMGQAYDRERRFLQVCMENERLGMRVDVDKLDTDCQNYVGALLTVEAALKQRLGTPEINFDADEEVAEALSRGGIVDDDKWVLTESGQRSVSKANLRAHMFNDPDVASALGYRNRLKTCLTMFMAPWLEQAQKTGGTIHTNWNQTRGEGGGTRTGRPSCNSHNFLNLSKDFESKKDGYVHPEFLGLPNLPLVRKYVLPDVGHRFLHRDFKGQELRVFAHHECGPLNDAYCRSPMLDPHDEWVRPIMEAAAGRSFDKTTIKVLNFQGLYGGGVPALSKALEITASEAKELRRVHESALPGKTALEGEIKRTFKRGEPIVTLGGRVNYCQAPGFDKKQGRYTTYEYRGLNTLVQGGAADLTKQACVEWFEHPDREARFLVQVYDEINVSAPEDKADAQMALLREIMEADRLSVPMRSDGKQGRSWGELVKCE